MADRTIHILLTRSGTCFSRFIYLVTQDRYTHASIGLDGPRGVFYSFGRKYEHLILPAGLVAEQVSPRRRSVPCCLYELTVSEKTYRRLRRRLNAMYARRAEYRYNLLGTLACFFQLSLQRKNCYFCSQFVADLLQECGAVELPKPPHLLRPVDFCQIEALRPIHQGPLEGILAESAA